MKKGQFKAYRKGQILQKWDKINNIYVFNIMSALINQL